MCEVASRATDDLRPKDGKVYVFEGMTRAKAERVADSMIAYR
jgi:hypothetical protein